VAIQQAGTVIAMLPGDQEKADVAARELVRQFEAGPERISGSRRMPPTALAYAIVAFPSAGQPLTQPTPVPAPRPSSTAATAVS
jgi:hypothetical protein